MDELADGHGLGPLGCSRATDVKARAGSVGLLCRWTFIQGRGRDNVLNGPANHNDEAQMDAGGLARARVIATLIYPMFHKSPSFIGDTRLPSAVFYCSIRIGRIEVLLCHTGQDGVLTSGVTHKNLYKSGHLLVRDPNTLEGNEISTTSAIYAELPAARPIASRSRCCSNFRAIHKTAAKACPDRRRRPGGARACGRRPEFDRHGGREPSA